MMRVRIITLSYSNVLEGLDFAPQGEFQRNHVCHQVREYFFRQDGRPRLTLILTYAAEETKEKSRFEADREEVKKLLNEKGYALFLTLKEWRNQTARAKGIPPYIIFDNRQLAHIAQQRPTTKTALMRIEGIGRKEAEEYWPALEKQLPSTEVPHETA